MAVPSALPAEVTAAQPDLRGREDVHSPADSGPDRHIPRTFLGPCHRSPAGSRCFGGSHSARDTEGNPRPASLPTPRERLGGEPGFPPAPLVAQKTQITPL